MLEEIGFEFSPRKAYNELKWENVYECLCFYRRFNDDLLVPQPFVIPEDGVHKDPKSGEPDPSKIYPPSLRGVRLGARVNAIRSQGTFVKNNPDRLAMLESIGFVMELDQLPGGKKRGRKKLEDGPTVDAVDIEALRVVLSEREKRLEERDEREYQWGRPLGDLVPGTEMGVAGAARGERAGAPGVPGSDKSFHAQDLVSPYDSERIITYNHNTYRGFMHGAFDSDDDAVFQWGAEYNRGEDAGKLFEGANSMKARELTTDEQRELIEFKGFTFLLFIDALESYISLMGDADVPPEFFVPEKKKEVVERAGTSAAWEDNEIGGKGAAALLSALESVNFEDEPGMGGLGGLEEFDEAGELMAGHDWPEFTHGLPLGNIVARIRMGDLNVKNEKPKKEVLDEMGFIWGDDSLCQKAPFERVLKACFAYTKIRGDMNVEHDFAVPRCEPWPSDIRGLELGKHINEIRSQKELYDEVYPKKKEMLTMMEFDWLPPMTEERAIPREERKAWFGKYANEVDDELMEFENSINEIEEEILQIQEEEEYKAAM